MTHATPDVGNIANAFERKPLRHQREEIEVPPMIAGVAEVFG